MTHDELRPLAPLPLDEAERSERDWVSGPVGPKLKFVLSFQIQTVFQQVQVQTFLNPRLNQGANQRQGLPT